MDLKRILSLIQIFWIPQQMLPTTLSLELFQLVNNYMSIHWRLGICNCPVFFPKLKFLSIHEDRNQVDIVKETVHNIHDICVFKQWTQRTLLSCWQTLSSHPQPCCPFQSAA